MSLNVFRLTLAAALASSGICSDACADGNGGEAAVYYGQIANYVSPHWKFGTPATVQAQLSFKRCLTGNARAHLPNALGFWDVTNFGGQIQAGTNFPGSTISGWMRFTNNVLSSWDWEARAVDGSTFHVCGPAPCQSSRAEFGRYAGDTLVSTGGTIISTVPGTWVLTPEGCVSLPPPGS